MDDKAIDRAIDDAARAMTAGEPDGSLRAHVMARIESGSGWQWRRAWLVPAAAVVALAVALFVARDRWLGVRQQSATQVALVAPAVPAPPAAPTHPDDPASARPEYARATARPAVAPSARRRPARPAAASEVAALAPATLSVPSISLTAIATADSIELPQLETIAPITLAPIGEPQGERP